MPLWHPAPTCSSHTSSRIQWAFPVPLCGKLFGLTTRCSSNDYVLSHCKHQKYSGKFVLKHYLVLSLNDHIRRETPRITKGQTSACQSHMSIKCRAGTRPTPPHPSPVTCIASSMIKSDVRHHGEMMFCFVLLC